MSRIARNVTISNLGETPNAVGATLGNSNQLANYESPSSPQWNAFRRTCVRCACSQQSIGDASDENIYHPRLKIYVCIAFQNESSSLKGIQPHAADGLKQTTRDWTSWPNKLSYVKKGVKASYWICLATFCMRHWIRKVSCSWICAPRERLNHEACNVDRAHKIHEHRANQNTRDLTSGRLE